MVLRNGQLTFGSLSWQKEDQRKGFNTAWTLILPNISCISEQSRDIHVDLPLQDNVLLPDDFAEHIHHIENAFEMHAITKSGLIPGGRSLKKDRQWVFFIDFVDWRSAHSHHEEEHDRRVLLKERPPACPYGQQKRRISEVMRDHSLSSEHGTQFTKIIGEFTSILYIGEIWSSLRRKDCNFTKHGHIQSFSTTHCLRFVLTKWYTWRLVKNPTAKCINPQGYRELYSRRICIRDVRIHRVLMLENPPTIKENTVRTGKPVAHFSRTRVGSIPEKVSDGGIGKPVAVTFSTEFHVFLTLPSKKKIRIARKPSKDWFNCSRITRTGTREYRIWTKLKTSIRSVKRRSWSPIWAIRKSSSFPTLLVRYNALIALYIGKRAISTAHAANACRPQKGIDSWTRQDTTSCQFPAMFSKRILPMVPDMDHLGRPCTTKHMICWGKPECTKVVVTKPFWKDGTMMTNTASLCQISGGLRGRSNNTTQLHWKINLTWLQLKKRSRNDKSWKISLNREGIQGPTNQRPDFDDAKHIQKTVWRIHRKNRWRKQIDPSCTANQTATWTTIRVLRWVQLHSWSSNRMAILYFIQTNTFVFVIALGPERQLEVKYKLGFLANLILDWTVFFLKKKHFSRLAIDGWV